MPPSELDVACPRCGAKPGRLCRWPSGAASRVHRARWRAWGKVMPEPEEDDARADDAREVRTRPLEHLVLALELAAVEPAVAEDCAELLDDAAGAIEEAATRCDGGAYWMDDHVAGRDRAPCAGCLALARRLRDRAGRIRAGTA